jgi:F-type H+-transporting ATPase subunit a
MRIVPLSWAFVVEFFFRILFKFIIGLVGGRGLIFFPFFLVLFIFFLLLNLLGLFPFGFTVTSHVVVTFFFSISILISCFFVGFLNYGFLFFRLFVTDSVPLFLFPFFILLEMLSYFIRIFSLSIRLSANMLAGHVLLHLLSMFFFKFLNLGFFIFFFLLVLILLIFLLEVVVAFLQAYVYITLTCVYFNESLYLH